MRPPGSFVEDITSALRSGSKSSRELKTELSSTLGRNVSLPQLVASLNKLEANGEVVYYILDPQPVRGARRKKIWSLK